MSELVMPSFWRKCSSCKAPIAFGQAYWICSVSTCNRQRTGLVFCTVSCFDAHVPMMNHKDAGAFEKRAPSLTEWQRIQPPTTMSTAPPPAQKIGPSPTSAEIPHDILVVVSKTKDYVQAKHQLNTSQEVMEVLSNRLRTLLDEASKRALQDSRKTLMARDFHF